MSNPFRRVLLLAVPALTSCNWLSLAANAWSYDVTGRGEASNIVVVDSIAYIALGEDGFAVADARTGVTIARLAPSMGSESADDLAFSNGRLWVLDARPPGHLTVYSLTDPSHPVPVGRSRDAPVGPFSGVAASGELCVVSGGTSRLTVWRLDERGELNGPVASGDLGRGQPDVFMARDGTAFVSAHYWGPYFGLDVVRLDGDSMAILAKIEIEGAGFTLGGSKPANFPIELAMANDSTLLVAYARGVAVVDIAQVAEPRIRRVIDVGGAAVNVDAAQGFAAVAVVGALPAIVILDSLGSVVRRISLPPGTNPSAVAFQGTRADRVLVAARDRGVMVLNR